MSKKIFRLLATATLVAAIGTGSAWAQGRGQGRGNAPSTVWRGDRDHDWRGDRDRWTFGNDQRPPGWDKGRKTGWGDCDVPPGQAKKMGCNSSIFTHRRRWDDRRDRDHGRGRDRR